MRFSQLEREKVGGVTESERRDCERRQSNEVVVDWDGIFQSVWTRKDRVTD